MKKVYDGYNVEGLGYPEMFTQLLPLISSVQRALDLGIGTGHLCSPVAFEGLQVVGVDKNEGSLTACKRLFGKAGLGNQLRTVTSDARNYLLSCREKYDLVMLSEILMFLKKADGKDLLKMSYDVLNANGFLWITARSTSDDFYFMLKEGFEPVDKDTFIAHSPCAGSTMVCFYSPGEIEGFLESIGGKVIFHTESINSAGGMTNIVLVQKPS